MSLNFDLEKLRAVRTMLVVGLTAFGEIERLREGWAILKNQDKPAPMELLPKHPTGNVETVIDFADALAYLDMLEDELLRAGMPLKAPA